MAEILIRAVDNEGNGPGVYKKGDPVVAMPDGHVWGKAETLSGGFYILKIPGMTVDEGNAYCQPRMLPDAVPDEVMLMRRDKAVDFTKVSFDAQGKATVLPAQAVQAFKRKP